MKKLVLFASVLALAACGGGGGAGGGSGTTSPRPIRAAIESPDSAVVASNAAITSMTSEVLAGDGEFLTPSLSRHSRASYNGQTYTSYRLDDVVFKVAGEDSIIKFGLNKDGKIISAEKRDKKNGRYVTSREGKFNRIDDSASFNGIKTMYVWSKGLTTADAELQSAIETALGETELPDGVTTADLVEYIKVHFEDGVELESDDPETDVAKGFKDEIAEEIDDWENSQPSEWRGQSWLASVATAAKEYYQTQITGDMGSPEEYELSLEIKGANIGLKYADLGYAELNATSKTDSEHVKHTFAPYVGGYSILDRGTVAQNTKFTGTAIAGVEHKDTLGNKESVLVRQDDAVLTLNTDGSSELVMNNLAQVGDAEKHWYTLTVQKGAGAHGAPTFIVGGDNTLGATYDMIHMPDEGRVAFTTGDERSNGEYERIDTTNGVRYGGSVENHVYGPNATDVEATSRFGFSDENTNTHEEIAIYGAFGGGNPTIVNPEP